MKLGGVNFITESINKDTHLCNYKLASWRRYNIFCFISHFSDPTIFLLLSDSGGHGTLSLKFVEVGRINFCFL